MSGHLTRDDNDDVNEIWAACIVADMLCSNKCIRPCEDWAFDIEAVLLTIF